MQQVQQVPLRAEHASRLPRRLADHVLLQPIAGRGRRFSDLSESGRCDHGQTRRDRRRRREEEAANGT